MTKAQRGICQYRCSRPAVGGSRFCEIHLEHERQMDLKRWRRNHPPASPEHLSEVRRQAAIARWSQNDNT